MFLFHDIAVGAVLGKTFLNHVLEVTEDEAADLLKNPHWRQATDAEVKAAAKKVKTDAAKVEADAEGADAPADEAASS